MKPSLLSCIHPSNSPTYSFSPFSPSPLPSTSSPPSPLLPSCVRCQLASSLALPPTSTRRRPPSSTPHLPASSPPPLLRPTSSPHPSQSTCTNPNPIKEQHPTPTPTPPTQPWSCRQTQRTPSSSKRFRSILLHRPSLPNQRLQTRLEKATSSCTGAFKPIIFFLKGEQR